RPILDPSWKMPKEAQNTMFKGVVSQTLRDNLSRVTNFITNPDRVTGRMAHYLTDRLPNKNLLYDVMSARGKDVPPAWRAHNVDTITKWGRMLGLTEDTITHLIQVSLDIR